MIIASFSGVVCSGAAFLGCCMYRRIKFLDIVAFGVRIFSVVYAILVI